jgi:hypothetical protein
MDRFLGSARSMLTSAVLFTKTQVSTFAAPAKRMLSGVGAAFLVLVLSVAPAVLAQTDTGSVRGTVTDPQGRVVADAQVAITNADIGYSRSVKTDSSGTYVFQSLPVGRYNLRVTGAQGFKAFEEKDILLHVNDNLTLDAKLTVGATETSVEVVANANQVELTTAEMSGTIAGAQITELPLNGRSFAQLLTLVPGVELDAGFSYDKKGLAGGADISISGGASNANLFLVDGANNVDVGSNRTILIYPSLDSIQEFKVERNSYNAQFGGAGGGIVTIVTKGGTNTLHGSAYYFGRNDLLDAFDPSLKAGNPTAKKDVIRRNDFGFSLGGPIKKDKMFFFVSEEWNRLIQDKVATAHVPTPLERTGDFSDAALDTTFSSATTVGCLPLGGLKDPTGGTLGFGTSPSTPGVVDIIPTAHQSAAGAAILNTYLLPTLPKGAPNYGCGNNFFEAERQPTFFREDSLRGDINFSKSLNLMLKYTGDYWDFGPSSLGNTGWGADSGASNVQDKWSQPGRIAVAKLSKVFGATAVNDFQFSYSANRINITQANANAAQNLNKVIPTFFGAGNTATNPPVWVSGGGLPTIWSFAPWVNSEDLYAWQDDYSKVINRHTLKTGVIYSRNAKNQQNFSQIQGFANGPVGFNGCKGNSAKDPAVCQALAAVTTGYGPSDYLLQNMAINWSEQNTIFNKEGRWTNFEMYVNDDWKVNNRLTLNLGLRYSYLPWPYQANDQMTIFNPAAFNPALGNAPCNGLFYSPGLSSNPCPNGTGGMAGPNRAIQNNFRLGFAPRLGVAWDPTGRGKWSIRAGFGQFYNRDEIYVIDGTGGVNPPFVSSFNSPNGNGRFLDSTGQLPACAPNCFNTGLGVAGIGQSLSSSAPYTFQYNLSVQHELWKDARFEIGYVGSQTKNWTSKFDANAIPQANRLAFAQSNGNAAGNALRPFAALTSGQIPFFAHQGVARYDSLQSAFSTHFNRNSIFQLTYTYSKTLADTYLHVSNGGGNLALDALNLGRAYGLSELNRPHILSANVIYMTPTMGNMQRLVRDIFGTWQLGSIVNVSSGSSLTPVINSLSNVNDPSGIGIGNGVELPNLVSGQPCRAPNFATTHQWLNPNRYTLNGFQLGTIGNAHIGDCEGPPTRTLDASLSKTFKLTERIHAQFRIDSFNLFNHPQWGNPGGGANNGSVAIGFNAPNSAALPEFLDATGHTTQSLANAVSLVNTAPNANATTVTSLSNRNREFQYSVRFTF